MRASPIAIQPRLMSFAATSAFARSSWRKKARDAAKARSIVPGATPWFAT